MAIRKKSVKPSVERTQKTAPAQPATGTMQKVTKKTAELASDFEFDMPREEFEQAHSPMPRKEFSSGSRPFQKHDSGPLGFRSGDRFRNRPGERPVSSQFGASRPPRSGFKPFERPREKPFERPNEKPIERLNDKPIERLNDKPIERLNDKPIERLNDKPIERLNDKPIERINEKPFERFNEKPFVRPNENLNGKLDVSNYQALPSDNVNEPPKRADSHPKHEAVKLDMPLLPKENLQGRIQDGRRPHDRINDKPRDRLPMRTRPVLRDEPRRGLGYVGPPVIKAQRVGVFVDVQNMYYSAKHLYDSKVNFKVVLEDGVRGRQLIRAIAYGIKADIKEEGNFFEALENIGFEVKTKDLQIFVDGSKKGDWDVGLAMDAMRLAPKLDVVVLVSGDGDFRDLVEYLKSSGCRVEVMAFKKTTSALLIGVADSYIDLASRKYLIK